MHDLFGFYGYTFFLLTMTDIENCFWKHLVLITCGDRLMDFIHAPLVFAGVLAQFTVYFPRSINLLNIFQCVSIEWAWINNLWALKNLFHSGIRYPWRKMWHLYILYSALSSVFMLYSKVLCVFCVCVVWCLCIDLLMSKKYCNRHLSSIRLLRLTEWIAFKMYDVIQPWRNLEPLNRRGQGQL